MERIFLFTNITLIFQYITISIYNTKGSCSVVQIELSPLEPKHTYSIMQNLKKDCW